MLDQFSCMFETSGYGHCSKLFAAFRPLSRSKSPTRKIQRMFVVVVAIWGISAINWLLVRNINSVEKIFAITAL